MTTIDTTTAAELIAPRSVKDFTSFVLIARSEGHTDEAIRSALRSTPYGSGAIMAAFRQADDPAARAAVELKEQIRSKVYESARQKASNGNRVEGSSRSVASRPTQALPGQWCRKCGGPVADGRGVCGEC